MLKGNIRFNRRGAMGYPDRGAIAVAGGGFALPWRQPDVPGLLQRNNRLRHAMSLELAIGCAPVPQLAELDR